MKALFALAVVALASPAFAQSPVSTTCCPCGGGCACPVGACPDCLIPVQTFLPVPGGKAASACPGGVCPLPAKAVAASAAGAGFFLDAAPHPVLHAAARPLGRLRGFFAAHHLFGRRCR